MPPARTNTHSETTHTSANEKEMLLGLLDALQSGRLRVLNPPVENAPFRPRMEIYDDPASADTVATFELPGVTSEQLSLGVKDNVLVVRGQRAPRFPFSSDGSARAAAQYRRTFPWRELRYGSFYRNLHLPPGVDTAQMKASLTDGLLVVSWVRPLAIAAQNRSVGTGNRVMARDKETEDSDHYESEEKGEIENDSSC
ncbi:SHSP domain-containing protein [Mycena kentingensis (nom. inval.)]|nr:SHSP domain-containing protein [Mycena kentingensis (nom. inval.)]